MTPANIAPAVQDVSRRGFLKTSTAAAGTAAAFTTFFHVKDAEALTTGESAPDPATPGPGESIVYRFSVCQNCHSRCGLMGKVVGPAGSTDPTAGVLVKLDGNPYHPNCMEDDERLSFSTAPAAAVNTPGRLCPKGQAGVQVLYDPYRIKHPLKNVGGRGSGRWQAISWAQAFSEIAARMNTLIPTGSRSTTLIHPTYTRLGPIANGLMFSPGRSTDGEIIQRVLGAAYGTQNFRLDHTSICEVSHHVANELMTWNTATNSARKNHFKPDVAQSDYIILFGANYLEANFPMLALARKVATLKKSPTKKLVVVDPRFSNSAAKADRWLPVRPGTDGAVALGMIWQILRSTGLINASGVAQAAVGSADSSPTATFLRNANSAAATADLETTWTDATRLVILATAGAVPAGAQVGEYLAQADWSAAGTGTNNVAWAGGVPVEIGAGAVNGDLFPGSQTITSATPGSNLAAGASITVKTVFQHFVDNVITPYSVQYYADIAGVDAGTLQVIAGEFLAAGKKAVANDYRGTVQHTNGLWSHKAVMMLNMLVGNFDWQGGNHSGAGTWSQSYAGMSGNSWTSTNGTLAAFGTGPYGPSVDRAKAQAAYTFELISAQGFDSYPAKRAWFPWGTHGNYQEVIPSINQQYPYACKVLITYWNAWPYSTPALKDVFLSTITDTSKVPLFVAIDNQMGETSAYADYILPDTTYLEKWSFPGNVMQTIKHTSFRQPLVGTFDGRAWDASFVVAGTNNYSPIYPDTKLFEDILLGLMSALGITTELNGTTALPANAWAHVRPAVTALAAAVNGASDPGRPGGGALTTDDIVARGGAFQDPNKFNYGTETGESTANLVGKLRYRYGNELKMYFEQIAQQIDSMGNGTTRLAPAVAGGGYLSVAHYEPIKDLKDNPVTDPAYPFQLITYKLVQHAQARTQNLPWLTCWMPENFIDMNTSDAAALGLRDYDKARISSASAPNGVVARVRVTEGIRPGVVAVSHHFGHWQQSAIPWTSDGTPQPADPSRSLGIQPNVIMRLDPSMGDVSLQDKIGASCSFSDTRVKIEKVGN